MKRLRRDPERFEAIDLFTAVALKQGYKLTVPGDINDFIVRISNSIKATQDNPRLIHGKRVESMFAHVAGALGRCKFIKQEDSGNVFAVDDNLQAPDYRLILDSGEQVFVEVKNCHSNDIKHLYPIKKYYNEKLENYAKINGIPLKYAIYYSHFNKWTLVSKKSLIEQKNRYVVNFVTAMAKNEMATIGDRTIATEPELVFELLADTNKKISIDPDGEARFIIGGVKMYCAGKEIKDENEKAIAFYLVRFGSWREGDAEAVYSGDTFVGVRYSYSPDFLPKEQRFAMIGELSSMVSSAYNEHTVYERSVIALDTKVEPKIFSIEIPKDYKGESLPLWQFTLEPNPEFTGQLAFKGG